MPVSYHFAFQHATGILLSLLSHCPLTVPQQHSFDSMPFSYPCVLETYAYPNLFVVQID